MEECKSVILRSKKKDKLYMFFKILLATIFSITIFLDSKLVFVKNIRGSASEIYFSSTSIKDIIIFIITWILSFVALSIIDLLIPKIENKICLNDKGKEKKKRVFWITFGILILLWMPYVLTYFPGGVFSDTQVSIKQCIHILQYDNKNPIAYTFLIKICLAVGDIFNSSQVGIDVFGICQITIMAGILSYFIYWLYKKNFSNTVLVLITLFFQINTNVCTFNMERYTILFSTIYIYAKYSRNCISRW